jgi:GH24 family phage-related lysozyme (muramidase)
MLYDRAQGKVLKGLVRRRVAEKKLFEMKVTEIA